jgi:Domain of unknown function (DUF5666)
MTDQIPPAPEPQPSVASVAARPVDEPPVAAFSGRTADRVFALRAGIVIGSALVIVVGAAVAVGASPGTTPSGVGAQPAASATTKGGGPNGNGFGNGGFGPGFGPGPLGFGPSAAGGFGPGSAGGFGPAFGTGDRRGQAFGQITVTAISGSTVSLRTVDGWTRTITVTSTTAITKGGGAATLADLQVGDSIRFAQKRNDDGTWTVTAIAILVPQTAGTVTAVGTATITISGRDGTTQTIETTGSTTYHLGKAAGSRADVTIGSMIVASGTRGSDGSFTATSVTVRLPLVFGTVSNVGSGTITITRPDGTTLTVHVGSATQIAVAGVGTAQLSDIKAGMAVVAEGLQRADGSLDATTIRAGQAGTFRGHDKTPEASPGASAGSSGG